MARAMWSGIIGFGMVSIPVKLYAATENHGLSFNQVHKKCKTRIKEVRWCPSCDREVEWSEIGKGYEYEKGKYVVLTEDDLKDIPLPSKNIIDVTMFVEQDQVDPIYFEKSYFLEPEPKAVRPFNLFIEALRKKSMLGIGTIALRTRERLCALRPAAGTLLVSTLLNADELRIDPTADFSKPTATKKELDMASNLIDLLTEKFEPAKYEDKYSEALMSMVQAKIDGEPIERTTTRKPKGEVVDLLDALQKSISGAKSATKPRRKTGSKKKASKGAA